MEHGASGYIFKNVSNEEFLQAVTKVANGEIYLNYEASYAMRQEKQRADSLPVLTKREKEVLQLIAEGLTNPQIAEKLFVSQSTIDSHRKSLMQKLQVKNITTLLKLSLENGLVTLWFSKNYLELSGFFMATDAIITITRMKAITINDKSTGIL